MARLSILIYHRVLPSPDDIFPDEIHAERFDVQLSLLKKTFNLLPLSEAIARLKSGALPSRSACITFDDGYADNYSIAYPILNKHGLQATFFIATGYLNGGRMFNDTVIHAIRHSSEQSIDLNKLGLGKHDLSSAAEKRKAIGNILSKLKYFPLGRREEAAEEILEVASNTPPPTDLMMTSKTVLKLREAGMEIGAHTCRHPILATLSFDEAHKEILSGKRYLESLIDERIGLFAYPNGKPGVDYLPEHVELSRQIGFDAALSTCWGVANKQSDLYQLPRFTPYGSNMQTFTPMLLKNLIH